MVYFLGRGGRDNEGKEGDKFKKKSYDDVLSFTDVAPNAQLNRSVATVLVSGCHLVGEVEE